MRWVMVLVAAMLAVGCVGVSNEVYCDERGAMFCVDTDGRAYCAPADRTGDPRGCLTTATDEDCSSGLTMIGNCRPEGGAFVAECGQPGYVPNCQGM